MIIYIQNSFSNSVYVSNSKNLFFTLILNYYE